jgi:hypothetical protein
MLPAPSFPRSLFEERKIDAEDYGVVGKFFCVRANFRSIQSRDFQLSRSVNEELFRVFSFILYKEKSEANLQCKKR